MATSNKGHRSTSLSALLQNPEGEVVGALTQLDELLAVGETTQGNVTGKKRKAPAKKGKAGGNSGGVGFGGDQSDISGMQQKMDLASKAEEEKDGKLQSIVEKLKRFLPMLPVQYPVLKKLQDSSGWCTLCFQLLRNDSFIDVGKRMSLYRPFLSLLLQLSKQPSTMEFISYPLHEEDEEDEESDHGNGPPTCQQLLISLGGQAKIFRRLQAVAKTGKSGAREVDEAILVADLIIDTEKAVNSFVDLTDDRASSSSSSAAVVTHHQVDTFDLTGDDDMVVWVPAAPHGSSSSSSSAPSSSSKRQKSSPGENVVITAADEAAYVRAMIPHRFAVVDMFGQIASGRATHLFSSVTLGAAANNKQRMTRIAKEMATLSTNLPVEYGSSVFMRVDETRMDLVKALIIGPEGTPYENGCFEFDIQLPAQYPQVPPQMKLVTTGQGTVRFNPNLYNCGKVCLSLLGTWAGPGWDPKHSTLLQVLVSIQALILVPDPYFNEPGYGPVTDSPASRSYNSNIRLQCMNFAMREQLRAPSPLFADVIRAHYRNKRIAVEQQLQRWMTDSPQHRTAAASVEAELDKLL